jgi:hypothetical protein
MMDAGRPIGQQNHMKHIVPIAHSYAFFMRAFRFATYRQQVFFLREQQVCI